MNITINTDASFCPETKAAGFAFYIVCDNFKIYSSGNFKKQSPENPMQAEMMCIGNALYALQVAEDLPVKCNHLVVNSDCITGMHHILNQKSELGTKIFKLWNSVIQKLKPYKTSMRHVKAHTSNPNNRSKANGWCDTKAKEWMKKQRLEIKSGKTSDQVSNIKV